MELLADAERLVERATAHGADQAEAYLEAGTSLDVEIESGRIAGSGRSQSQGGAIRVLRGGRLGFAYFTRLDRAEAAIEQALENARLATPLEMTLPGPGHGPLGGRFDDDVAALDPDMAVAAANDLARHAAVADGSVAGGVSLGVGYEAIANSEGVSCQDQTTLMQAYASLVLADGQRSVNVWDTVASHGLVDLAAPGEKVARMAQDLRGATPAQTGRADIILLPEAATELVTGVTLGAVDGDSAMRGKSFWSDDVGRQVAHPGLSITDVPQDPAGIGTAAFDGEGAATRRTPILEAGTLHGFLFNARDAARHGQKPTGHAARDGFKAPPGTGAHHVVVEHQHCRPLDALMADVEDGFLVQSVLGAHTANATTGDFSVSAPNVWRIKDGGLAGACQEIAIGGNLPDLLRRLDGVGDDAKQMVGARVPSLRLRDVQVSA